MSALVFEYCILAYAYIKVGSMVKADSFTGLESASFHISAFWCKPTIYGYIEDLRQYTESCNNKKCL